jgi:hypothetical protein
VLALEEPTNDTKTEPKRGDQGDLILDATTTDQYSPDNALERPGRESADAADKTSGCTDSTSPEITGAHERKAR